MVYTIKMNKEWSHFKNSAYLRYDTECKDGNLFYVTKLFSHDLSLSIQFH